MPSGHLRWILLGIGAISWLVTIAWVVDAYQNGQSLYEAVIGFLTGLVFLIAYVLNPNDNIDEGPIQNIITIGQQAISSGPIAQSQALCGGVSIIGDIYGSTIGTSLQVSDKQNVNQSPYEIPSPPADFTGRDDELQNILNHFDRGRTIVGLRGMGGIGKTALAFKLSKELTDRYPDGQIFLELKGTDPEPLTPAEAMAHAIHAYNSEALLPEDESELSAVYRNHFHGKHALLLLDNAVDDQQVRPLLLPDTCGVIVTSRENIALQGLIPIDLDVLKPDKAVELLLRVRKPDQLPIAPPLDEESWKEIATLCGFLPLALRAAGSFLANRPDISLVEYIRGLGDECTRLRQIGKEGTGLYVDASFNLSYNRLPTEIAQVFRMLSVFPADFDSNAEEEICQDENHRYLSELLRWNLVEYLEGKGRYRLHDLVRLFAASRLEKDDGEKALGVIKLSHAVHYKNVLSNAETLFLKGEKDLLVGLALFDLERYNIRAGEVWVENAAMQADIMNIGPNEEEALRLCSIYPLVGINIFLLRLNPSELIRWLESALAAARELNDRGNEGSALGNLGLVYNCISEYRKAIEFHEQHLAIATEIGSESGQGISLVNLGNAYRNLSEYRKSIDYHEQALAIFRGIGDRRGEEAVLGSLGITNYKLGEYRKAVDFLEQALVISQDICDLKGEGNALGNLGNVYYALGEYHKSINFLEKALAIVREIGDRQGEGAAMGCLGLAYNGLGNYRKAIEFHKQQLIITKEVGDRHGEGNALGGLGLAYHLLEEYSKAIEFFEQYLDISRQIGDQAGEGAALGSLGNTNSKLGEYRKAIKLHEQYLAIAREIGDQQGEGNALFNMSLSLYEIGNRELAKEYAKLSLSIFERIQSPYAEKARRKLAEWKD